MAGGTPMIAGQVRIAHLYTPADLANPTSNRLYQRLGYRAVADFELYEFKSSRVHEFVVDPAVRATAAP